MSTSDAACETDGTAVTPRRADDDYLGPGEVLAADSAPRVRLGDEAGRAEVPVELALAFPYAPRPGDRLLVVRRAGGPAYAIGVLSGAAQAALRFEGDVDLWAVGGTLSLRGGEGVEVEAPRVSLRAEALRTFAETVTERADSAYRWVKDLLTVRAGESRRTVHGEDHSRARRSVTLAEETLKIDGHQVHLGH